MPKQLIISVTLLLFFMSPANSDSIKSWKELNNDQQKEIIEALRIIRLPQMVSLTKKNKTTPKQLVSPQTKKELNDFINKKQELYQKLSAEAKTALRAKRKETTKSFYTFENTNPQTANLIK